MITLVSILKEIQEDQNIDLSDLKKLPDLIGDELEKASEEQNEAILTVAALALSAPGIIKTVTKVIEIIAKKSGIDLRKKKNLEWYKVISNVANKIDDYLDTPLKTMLRPFITDSIKRDKTVKFLKAITLTVMAIMGGIDASGLGDVASKIKELSGALSGELIQSISQQSLPKIAEILKSFMTNLK